jgi:hypothetical protein
MKRSARIVARASTRNPSGVAGRSGCGVTIDILPGSTGLKRIMVADEWRIRPHDTVGQQCANSNETF